MFSVLQGKQAHPAALDRRGNTACLESPPMKGPTPRAGGWEGHSALCPLSPTRPRPCHTPTTSPSPGPRALSACTRTPPGRGSGQCPPPWVLSPILDVQPTSRSETPRSNFLNFQILERESSIYAVFYITHSTSGMAPLSSTSVYLQQQESTFTLQSLLDPHNGRQGPLRMPTGYFSCKAFPEPHRTPSCPVSALLCTLVSCLDLPPSLAGAQLGVGSALGQGWLRVLKC